MRPLACLLAISIGSPAAGPLSFVRDIQPIFERRCTGCHSATATMGSLNLETWSGLQQGGNNGPIVVPGKSKESTLWLSITGNAPAIGRMPFSNETMPEAETELIREWIDDGAAGPAPAVSPAPQIYSLAWRPDGKAIAVGGYQTVRLMDATGKTETSQLSGHAEVVRALAWSRDGSILAAAGGLPGRKGEVKIWTAALTLQATISGHADCIYGLAISPDGKTIATSSYDKMIYLWDSATGKEIRRLKDHIDAVYALSFSPDGKRVASASADRSVKVWDVSSGERLYTLSDATDGLNSVAFSPDGKWIAAAGLDKSVRLWPMLDKAAPMSNSLIAHEDAVLRVVWSPDSKTLVSASADRSLKFFRASDLTELKVLGGQPDWVYALEFSPDGKHLAVGALNGSLQVLEISK
jgi:WD40 repeat protein